MSSEVTRITNIVEPSVFMPYMLERTNTLSELIQAGIVVRDPKMEVSPEKIPDRLMPMPKMP